MSIHTRTVDEGERFGRWTILELQRIPGRRSLYFLCQCDCGAVKSVSKASLCIGGSTSCGCYQREHARQKGIEAAAHGHARETGASSTYSSWKNMKRRCLCPSAKDYRNYGGRGITICERWLSFSAFLEDMGEKPSEKHSIERNDNNLGYSPDNCKWATKKEQHRNMRTTALVEFGGVTKSRQEWAEITGLSNDTIRHRLKSGCSVDDALTRPANKHRPN